MRPASRIVGVVAGAVLALAALPAGVAAAVDPCANNVAGVVSYDVSTSPTIHVCLQVGQLDVAADLYTVQSGIAPPGDHYYFWLCYGPQPFPYCVDGFGDRTSSASVSPLGIDTDGFDIACLLLPTDFYCFSVDGSLKISTERMGAGGALVISGVIAACVSSPSLGIFCEVPFWNTVTIPLPPPII
ncbi:MAG: hypothetical protein QOC82_827 [Frankiaceae bacterium]|jgi:hypothetical protein|nr:hypothetical protein [Frankiaceae bacterium]